MSRFLLLNTRAGAGRARRLARPIQDWLARSAPDVRFLQPDGVTEAHASRAELPRGSRVVVVGGDGTVNAMLPALLAGGHSLGLVAAGSGNDVARALGLWRWGWRRMLAHALDAEPRACDLGLVRWQPATGAVAVTTSRWFASSWTAGFDAAIVDRADHGPRGLRGLPRYLLATLREVSALSHHAFEVRVDGAPRALSRGLFCSVLNTPTFGSGMPAVPHARVDDRRLDLLFAGALGPGATLAMLPRLLLGRHLADTRLSTETFSMLSVRVAGAGGVPVAADGEFLGRAQAFEVEVRPGALRVVGA